MSETSAEFLPARERRSSRILWLVRALAGDPMAVVAAIWLLIVLLAILADASSLLGDNRISLKARNLPPFDFSQTWTLWIGADALGRPLLVRLIQAASTTIGQSSATRSCAKSGASAVRILVG